MEPLRMRQIHLDFHTSAPIGDVGADWDAQAFVETLQRAHVNSITCFARCHHGYTYYMPTKFTIHPALKFDLLGAQIAACHQAGIRAPIYVTVGWDELTSSRHPEWNVITPEGVRGSSSPLAARWKDICFSTPYLDYVWEQVEELFALFGDEVDGFFFDIIHQRECVCPWCLAGMAKAGLNPEKQADRIAYGRQVEDAYRRRFAEGVRAHSARATIFHNAGHVGYAVRDTVDTFSHLELESLPSTGMWGYNHFPISVRYTRTLGKPLLGMTGKFHTAWGDFGSFKNQAALEYECFQMLANGAACSIGDQLHPRGRLSEPAYELIGRVYASVEAKEPWCIGAEAQADIAVFNVEAVGADDGRVDTAHSGVLRMLLEAHQQFDFVDERADWSKYRVLVFPDKVSFDAALTAKVKAYLAGGGKVIATYKSGLTPDGAGFALPEFGVELIGDAPYSPDYARPAESLGAFRPEQWWLRAYGDRRAYLHDAEYVMYDRGLAVRPAEGAQSLAETWAPYFNRTWEHFCSHRQTPPDFNHKLDYPTITMNAAGNVIYFAHPIFTGYRRQAVLWYKTLFLAALKKLLPDPLVLCEAPSTAQVSILRQPDKGRTIVHLLHYIPERRGLEFDTIEDVIPIYNIALAFKAPPPQAVYLAPSGQKLPYAYADGYVKVNVPEVVGHQMVVAE